MSGLKTLDENGREESLLREICGHFFFRSRPSVRPTQNQSHEPTEDLVREKEKQRCQGYHHQNHEGGDPHLFPGRPCDLGSLLANFLNKLDGIVFGHQSDFPGQTATI